MKTKLIKYVSQSGKEIGTCDAYRPLPKKNDRENINLINYLVTQTKKTGDTLIVTLKMNDNLKRFDFIR